MIVQNPKLVDSGIIDCIPQIGNCPIHCDDNCFFNSDLFFASKKEPLLPTLEEVGNKIVRVNSGNDSNNQKNLVIESTRKYCNKFYNTSIPDFDFPGPVVFTVNGKYTDFGAFIVKKNLENCMMVRFRTNSWNLDLLKEVVNYYGLKYNIPVTLTFMRYKNIEDIPEKERGFYEIKKNITNEYYQLNTDCKIQAFTSVYQSDNPFLVGCCGTFYSNLCKDCGRCTQSYDLFYSFKK